MLHAATWNLAQPLLHLPWRQVLIYLHGLEILDARRESPAQLEKTLNAAHALISNSRHVADLAQGAGAHAHRLHVVHPSIDPARLAGRDHLRRSWNVTEGPVLLTLGRLVPRKGQDMMIRSLPGLLADFPDLVYVIAGKGQDENRLRAISREQGIHDRVRFTGFVPEESLGAAYRSCTLYAMPCREWADDVEGFGITYLEAAACGRPALAGDSGGAPEAVIHGRTGLLADPNSPRSIAATLRTLLERPALARRLGAQARHRVLTDLSRQRMVERVLQLCAGAKGQG